MIPFVKDYEFKHLSDDSMADSLAARVLKRWTSGLNAKATELLSEHDQEALRAMVEQACAEAVSFGRRESVDLRGEAPTGDEH